MWAAEQRARHKVAACKERRGYPTDISDKEWKLVEPLLHCIARTGRPSKTGLRQVINALRYLVRSGCEWRMPCCPNRYFSSGGARFLRKLPNSARPDFVRLI